MHDITTIALNCTLMFLVLFYVYPLKFLFTLIFSDEIYGVGNSPFIMTRADTPKLMLIYGIGYILIYVLFFCMYGHAFRRREELELTTGEIFDTKTSMYTNVILIIIGFISLFMISILPQNSAGFAGMAYILIGPAFSIFYAYRGRKKRRLHSI